MAKAARATDSVQVGLRILREVKVDDNVDGLDVDTTGEKVRRHQVAARTVAEVMEDAVTVSLDHLGVNVEAGVTELGDFPGEQLDTSDAVAEDNRLVDLQLAEQSVQAVDLLLFFNEGVVLGDTLQREFLHEVDDVRFAQVLVLEFLDGNRESSRVQENLSVLRHEVDNLGDDGLEFRGKKLIRLVHCQHRRLTQLCDALARQVDETTRSGDNNVHRLVQSHNVILQRGTTGGDHDGQTEVLAEFLAHLARLQRQLPSWDENHSLNHILARIHLFKNRNTKSSRLTGPVLRACENITTGERDWQRSSWIGEGRSKPFSKIPIKSSRLRK